VPGVLGNAESYQHDSFYEDDNLSQFPQYTRPESLIYRGKELKVPDILLSGHHAEIEKWRKSGVKKVAAVKTNE
jgi:tRNA (guanine37-N1)-methyltransferase